MTFRAKLPYIISTILIVIISSWLMSNNTPFTGDEFYTLDIENIHKPIPYRMIVAEVIEHLRPITPGNIFSLRFTSILFTLISVMLFYIYLIRDKYEMIVFSILIITSSFCIHISYHFTIVLF